VRRLEPGLRDKGLRGAALYYDAQADDARLVLATVRSAAQAGARVASYAEATSLLKPDGRVRGAVVRDALTDETHVVRALTVVNATGPWVDAVRRLDDPDADSMLRMTKGAHVAVARARLGNQHAVTLTSPLDGRVMFVLPWGDLTYVGTTDTDEPVALDDLRASGADVTYLLRSANAVFPGARLGPADVLSTWAGMRALVRSDPALPPSAVSREHRLEESAQGLITIAGGKLTTYRAMAAEVVDLVARRLRELDGRPAPRDAPTDRVPLPGGEAAELGVLVEAARARGATDATAAHLVGSYGSEWAAVLNLADRDRKLGEPIVAGRPEIWAEVVHAVEREMALRLTDCLIRRVHVFYEDPGHGTATALAVARRMGKLLHWSETRVEDEVGAYLDAVRRMRSFMKELPRRSG
ncbi:MAG: glycerol-3-phosphate dehydrogenase/oxidase, partial [Gammaproteobacteria bacterium]